METQTYSFPNGFTGGLRIDLAPDRIPSNASPDMENMTLDAGVPSKRFGFTKLSDVVLGDAPIRLMTEFKVGDETEFLIVCDGAIYKRNGVR